MLKIRRPLGRLIFNMGIAIPGKTVFLIETAPRCPWLKRVWRAEITAHWMVCWDIIHCHHNNLQLVNLNEMINVPKFNPARPKMCNTCFTFYMFKILLALRSRTSGNRVCTSRDTIQTHLTTTFWQQVHASSSTFLTLMYPFQYLSHINLIN